MVARSLRSAPDFEAQSAPKQTQNADLLCPPAQNTLLTRLRRIKTRAPSSCLTLARESANSSSIFRDNAFLALGRLNVKTLIPIERVPRPFSSCCLDF